MLSTCHITALCALYMSYHCSLCSLHVIPQHSVLSTCHTTDLGARYMSYNSSTVCALYLSYNSSLCSLHVMPPLSVHSICHKTALCALNLPVTLCALYTCHATAICALSMSYYSSLCSLPVIPLHPYVSKQPFFKQFLFPATVKPTSLLHFPFF